MSLFVGTSFGCACHLGRVVLFLFFFGIRVVVNCVCLLVCEFFLFLFLVDNLFP